ncbi:MAG: RNA-binding protein [Oscillospiraceae bacterium]
MRSFPGIRCDIDDDERIFLAHVEDMISLCERDCSPKYTDFLDERRAMLARSLLEGRGYSDYRFFGGYEGAVRTQLCVYPEYFAPDDADYPIKAVRFSYRSQDKPTHSQFLGTIMSLQIKRGLVGDIIVSEGHTDVLVCLEAADDVLSLSKIGRVGVKTALVGFEGITRQDSFDELSRSVSSLRLDCVVSAATDLSRDKTSALIKAEGIDVNYSAVYSPSHILSEGDVFSVRGKGKFILSETGGRSRRDRIFITLKKYR